MSKRSIRKKVIYGILAAVSFALLLAFTQGEKERNRNVEIVVFGDSVYGNVRDGSGIPDLLGAQLGKTVYNAGFGGTCASRIQQTLRLDYSGDSLSLAALAKAVYADDFGVQLTIKPVLDLSFYFGETIEGLASIDFSSVEMTLIGYGGNDFYGGVPLENEADEMDEYSFGGALRKSITMLRKANPNMRIVLLTPTYSWLTSQDKTCEEYDVGRGILEDYVRKEMEVAEELGVEVIDLYHDLFPHEVWEDWKTYTEEGLHPNEAGRVLMTERIVSYLQSVPERAASAP